jgi:hypothetical protein
MIVLPCLGESLVRKLLEAHPWISVVVLLMNLSDESSQKFCQEESRCKPPEGVMDSRWLGSDKILPCDHHK